MSKFGLSIVLVLGVAACGSASGKDGGQQGSSSGQVGGAFSKGTSLASGSVVRATIQDSLSSRINKAGETVRAIVSADVKDHDGRVVIPAASTVTLTIDHLDPGNDQAKPNGVLSLVVASIDVGGVSQAVTANLEEVPYHMVGRSITKDGAERIGGRTAVAVRYAYRDVVVAAGTPIVFTLAHSLTLAAK
jgi:hypothetical protein